MRMSNSARGQAIISCARCIEKDLADIIHFDVITRSFDRIAITVNFSVFIVIEMVLIFHATGDGQGRCLCGAGLGGECGDPRNGRRRQKNVFLRISHKNY